MYSLNQLIISNCKRQWILMDIGTCLPLLYPLRYHIDHLAHRSLSTQSASLQAVKFFYEFWQQKYGVTFCYSFYSSGHNPDIAIGEMSSFLLYLENGRVIQSKHQPNYQTKLADIEQRLQQLEAMQTEWLRRAEAQQLVAIEDVVSGEINTEGEIRTLAQLFALEHRKLMQEDH